MNAQLKPFELDPNDTKDESVVVGAQKKRRVYLSHSARQAYMSCARKYRYVHVDKLTTVEESSNLGFGSAVHKAVEVFLTRESTGKDIGDPIVAFQESWDSFCANHVVSFSSRWTKEKMEETGRMLVLKFMQDWQERGLIVVLDQDGRPVLERKLRIELPNAVIYTAVVDILAMTPEGQVVVIDVKTPGTQPFEGFALLSEQLIGYQIVMDAHKDGLNIEQIDARAFYELYKTPVSKRSEGPRVLPLETVPRASQEQVNEWLMETLAIADDIRDKRFPKRPGDAYASPCRMCEFIRLCTHGDMTGIKKRDE